MSARVSLALMVLFMVLGTFALFDPLRTREKEEERQDRESHVLWLKEKKLSAITISPSAGRARVRLECAKKEEGCPFDGTGDWVLLEPLQDNADPSAVGSLASTLLNLTHHERVDLETGLDPREFGLDAPEAEVSLQLLGEKEPVRLRFGKASPVGPNVYLQVGGQARTLFLVPNYLPGMINKDLFHWRDKRLFPSVDPAAVVSLTWKSGKSGELHAARAEEGWRLERPVRAEAGRVMLESLASTVAYASAKDIRPSPGPEGKLVLEIGFTMAGKPRTLRLFEASKSAPGLRQLLARVDGGGPLYLLDAAPFDRFRKPLADYRRPSLLDDQARGRVDEVRFTFPRSRGEATVKRVGSLWSFAGPKPPTSPLSQERVDAFLDSLRDEGYKAFFPLRGPSREVAAYRAHAPDLRVELRGKGELLAEASYLVFERKAALTESEGDVRSLGEPFLRNLPVRLEDLSQVANQTVVAEPAVGKEPADGHRH